MSFKYGKKSLAVRETLDEDLKKVVDVAIQYMDCSLLSGYRGEEEQNSLYHAGKSTLLYPNSKHNKNPSLAVDIVPYPIDWNDIERFDRFVWFLKGIAAALNIDIECGADWKSFKDYPHIQLSKKKPEYKL